MSRRAAGATLRSFTAIVSLSVCREANWRPQPSGEIVATGAVISGAMARERSPLVPFGFFQLLQQIEDVIWQRLLRDVVVGGPKPCCPRLLAFLDMCFPAFIWAALRFRQLGAAASSLIESLEAWLERLTAVMALITATGA
jgi:hypothetical protein